MKMQMGVYSQSGLLHNAVVTAANMHDEHPLRDLLHGNSRRVCGDSACASQKDLVQDKALNARDFTNEWTRNARCEVDEVKKAKNRNSQRFVRASSISLRWSSGFGTSTRFGTAGWPRTQRARS